MKHLSQNRRGGALFGRMLAMLLSLFVVLSPVMAWAQNSVKGTVVDEAGEPVIGATVIVVGTQTGTTTDINGQFSLQNRIFLEDLLGHKHLQITLLQEPRPLARRFGFQEELGFLS